MSLNWAHPHCPTKKQTAQALFTRMIGTFRVLLNVFTVKVNIFKFSGQKSFGLVCEMLRRRATALPSRDYRPGFHFFAEFHHAHETVSDRAITFLCIEG